MFISYLPDYIFTCLLYIDIIVFSTRNIYRIWIRFPTPEISSTYTFVFITSYFITVSLRHPCYHCLLVRFLPSLSLSLTLKYLKYTCTIYSFEIITISKKPFFWNFFKYFFPISSHIHAYTYTHTHTPHIHTHAHIYIQADTDTHTHIHIKYINVCFFTVIQTNLLCTYRFAYIRFVLFFFLVLNSFVKRKKKTSFPV